MSTTTSTQHEISTNINYGGQNGTNFNNELKYNLNQNSNFGYENANNAF